MNPLLLTTLFLVLFGIFGFHAQKRSYTLAQMEVIYQSHHNVQQLTQNLEQSASLERLKEERDELNASPKKSEKETKKPLKRPKKSNPLNYDLARPPKEARLNLGHLIRHFKEPDKQNILSSYQICARLLRNLYNDHPAFQDSPGIEYKIIDELIKQKTLVTKFKMADQLSTLSFDSESLQELFYFMLKGGFVTKESRRIYLPSLLCYVGFHHSQNINLLFAPPELVKALIPDSEMSAEVLLTRESLWNRIFNQEALRKTGKGNTLHMLDCKAVEEQFKTATMTVLERKNLARDQKYLKLFTFIIGSPGDLLIIRDPKTGITQSKLLPPKSKNK